MALGAGITRRGDELDVLVRHAVAGIPPNGRERVLLEFHNGRVFRKSDEPVFGEHGVERDAISKALSVDKHEHSGQGFYVATRLGDFNNEIPESVNVESPPRANSAEADDVFKTGEDYGDDEEEEEETTTDTKSCHTNKSLTNKSSGTDEETEAVSDVAAAGSKRTMQIASSTAEDIQSDILSALVPECGVPIPSVMAKVGSSRARALSKGGMLLPWHSTRSIQNYQHHGRRGKKKGQGSSVYSSSRSRDGSSQSIFSISSVHTFRG